MFNAEAARPAYKAHVSLFSVRCSVIINLPIAGSLSTINSFGESKNVRTSRNLRFSYDMCSTDLMAMSGKKFVILHIGTKHI